LRFIVKEIPGIYCIENIVNGKKYTGKAYHIYRRWNAHRNELNGNRSRCEVLQRAWNKYGEENFRFTILIICERSMLNDLEKFFIKNLHSHVSEGGYNIAWGGQSSFEGRHHTEESKQKLREAHIGTTMSEEAKQKDRESNMGEKNGFFGKHHTDEAKEKMSQRRESIIGDKNPAYGKHYNQGIQTNKNAKNKYVGVRKRKGKTYSARIHYNGEEIYLGSFKTEENAAKAYNEAALKYYGEDAKLNIINEEKDE
jgi:group I intron endonuclease